MLLAGRKRRQLRVPHYDAGGHARVRRHGFVPAVASDNAWPRMAHHASQHQNRRLIAVFLRELGEARRIAINNGSRRYSVNERSVAETLERKRTRQRRRATRDDFRHVRSATLDGAHDFQQLTVAVVRRHCPYVLVWLPKLAVIVVDTAKLQSGLANRARQRRHLGGVLLLDSRPVHAGIYVD